MKSPHAGRVFTFMVATLVASVVPVTAGLAAGAGRAAAAATCPCSLWSPTTVPTNIEANDAQAVELGVQFKSSVPGDIIGIRFFKGPDNTGLHVGSLWSSDGTELAQYDFANESASGWQQVNFATPIAINANTIYVAGYHTNTGFYSFDAGYFTSNTYSNPPLSAPSDASGTPNGVFAYSPTPVFPTGTYNGNNYWVDVVFVPSAVSIQVGVPQPSPPKGTSEELSATETFSDGSTADVTSQVAWATSNSNATVSPGGELTAVAVGSSVVSATLNGLTGTARISVAPAALTAISISAPSKRLPAGVTEQLTASGTYTDGTTADLTSLVTWSSSASSVLDVSATGLASGVSKGSASAIAALAGISGSADLRVLAHAAFLTISPTVAFVRQGRTRQFRATAWLVDGTEANVSALVRWRLVPSGAATISPSGVFTGRIPGIAAVSATLSRLPAFALVVVIPDQS